MKVDANEWKCLLKIYFLLSVMPIKLHFNKNNSDVSIIKRNSKVKDYCPQKSVVVKAVTVVTVLFKLNPKLETTKNVIIDNKRVRSCCRGSYIWHILVIVIVVEIVMIVGVNLEAG